ncbi:MAG: ACP S-malonyltransferase [Spirochaetia bacterium]
MKRCFLYPGQGAQFPGMGKDLYDEHPDVRELFETATSAAGFDVAELIFSGSEDDLKATDRSQVAITTVNLAARRVLLGRGVESAGAAGFSLGEYSALVDSGILSEGDALQLVTLRGRIMERVSRSLDSDGGAAGMAAVIGMSPDAIFACLEEADVVDAYPANLNSPVQTVLSGTAAGLERASAALKECGARRVITLKVSGPFHSPLMQAAKDDFSKELAGFEFKDPQKPFYANVKGGAVDSGNEARRLCAEQLVAPVRWVDEESAILADSYDELLEVGPGEVLGGLWKAFIKGREEINLGCSPAGKLDQITAMG